MPIDPNTGRSDLDVLSTTELARWRDIPFVVGAMSWGFDQQHTVHAYPDRDAGFVESTGRNVATFSFTAIFRRGVVHEGGGPEAFPNDMLRFQAACADRTVGLLVHPILGTLKAKCKTISAQVDPLRRDGADVEVSFVEATDREDELAALLAQRSALGSAYSEARKFDDEYEDIKPKPPALPASLSPSLLESLKQLDGALKQAQLGIGNVFAKIDGMANAVNDLSNTIAGLDNPKNSGAVAALERLFAALVKLAKETRAQARAVRPAVVPRGMSLPEAAATYKMQVGQFLKLNPLLAGFDEVPSGTAVFIYV